LCGRRGREGKKRKKKEGEARKEEEGVANLVPSDEIVSTSLTLSLSLFPLLFTKV
jgi:hypothetical protein